MTDPSSSCLDVISYQVEELRQRLEEKNKLIEKKTQAAMSTTQDRNKLTQDLQELRDHIDIKDRKINVLQRKVCESSSLPLPFHWLLNKRTVHSIVLILQSIYSLVLLSPMTSPAMKPSFLESLVIHITSHFLSLSLLYGSLYWQSENLEDLLKEKDNQLEAARSRISQIEAHHSTSEGTLSSLEEAIADKDKQITQLREQRDRADKDRDQERDLHERELAEMKMKLHAVEAEIEKLQVNVIFLMLSFHNIFPSFLSNHSQAVTTISHSCSKSRTNHCVVGAAACDFGFPFASTSICVLQETLEFCFRLSFDPFMTLLFLLTRLSFFHWSLVSETSALYWLESPIE